MNTLQQQSARAICQRASGLMLAHKDEIHYTQGPLRWEGIDRGLRVVRNQFPAHGDCSSTVTWIMWNALTHAARTLNVPDIVNGEHWAAGFTGTIADHGIAVHSTPILGDLILYGPGAPWKHVTMALGGGMCFSHGGEAGPYKLPIHYRGDVGPVRRFIF